MVPMLTGRFVRFVRNGIEERHAVIAEEHTLRLADGSTVSAFDVELVACDDEFDVFEYQPEVQR